MPNRSSKKPSKLPSDVNQLAKAVVEQATVEDEAATEGEKNPAAVALGRLGGLKGGKARAEKLSKKERSAIARKAALSRWSHKKKG